MQLIPIKQTIEENGEFINDPVCESSLAMSVDFYKKVGFVPPWLCYYVKRDGVVIGGGGFVGKPVDGTVEIAYFTAGQYQKQGVGTAICKLLVDLALQTDPTIKITAKTLPEKNLSTRILEKNNFVFNSIVHDDDEGYVWSWVYVK